MTKITLTTALILLLLTVAFQDVTARGKRDSTSGPGTGSNTKSHSVKGYSRKDGTYVAPHRQSNPDKNFKNNWSTNPNTNPYTGKEGTRREPPSN